MPPIDLIRELKARKMNVHTEPRIVGSDAFVIIDPYVIEVGQHAGKTISVAIPTPPDFPITPPGGLHVKPHLIPVGTRNVHASPLGNDWQYWSRPTKDWRQDRSVSRLLSQLNTLMLQA